VSFSRVEGSIGRTHTKHNVNEQGRWSEAVAPGVGPVREGGTACGNDVRGGAACWVGMIRDAGIDLEGVASGGDG
jgi:hypothetical protein